MKVLWVKNVAALLDSIKIFSTYKAQSSTDTCIVGNVLYNSIKYILKLILIVYCHLGAVSVLFKKCHKVLYNIGIRFILVACHPVCHED